MRKEIMQQNTISYKKMERSKSEAKESLTSIVVPL